MRERIERERGRKEERKGGVKMERDSKEGWNVQKSDQMGLYWPREAVAWNGMVLLEYVSEL